jgi:uncharacterized protein (DUF1684 family)
MEELELLDWKRRIFALYGEIRSDPQPERAWQHWCDVREELFRSHPQTPAAGAHLHYFDYDPALRVHGTVEAAERERREIATSGEEPYSFTRFARTRFELGGEEQSLDLYWLEGYGGGVFLPFGDETTGRETYGGGRYLLDTVKGSDLGTEDGRLVLDFNFAYNPSCAYDPSWACPLSAAANRLPVPITAGERAPV